MFSKNQKFYVLLCFLLSSMSLSFHMQGQGCVAIRGNSGCGNGAGLTTNLIKGEFSAQVGFRHFKSFRHFRGDHEETHRVDEGTEVLNYSSFLDLSLNYGITDRLFGNIVIPFVYHKRSSMYEHGGNPPNGLGERHETSAYGLADIRLGVGYWLFDPSEKPFNYAFSIGLKLPSGNAEYSDLFYNQGENRDINEDKVVDQSIQPGDGGIGVALNVQGYHPLSSQFGISSDLFYMLGVQSTNGILTRSGSSEFSCPDQFAARLSGVYNTSNGLSFNLGGRIEGVPSEDLVGSSEGYRRPGHAISVEPGIGYTKNNTSIFVSVPIAIYRNRIQSFSDKERTLQTGVYRHGDAAFADYLINIGFAHRFGKSSMGSHEM